MRSADQLTLLARGLGLLRLVANLLHMYDATGEALVLVVGATETETQWLGEAVAEQNALSRAPRARGLTVVNTDAMSVERRRKTYAGGGVFAVTSRIAQVDLLTGAAPRVCVSVHVARADRPQGMYRRRKSRASWCCMRSGRWSGVFGVGGADGTGSRPRARRR